MMKKKQEEKKNESEKRFIKTYSPLVNITVVKLQLTFSKKSKKVAVMAPLMDSRTYK